MLGWKTLGHEARLKDRIVNYADDFVICCRGTAAQAMTAMQEMMSKLKLTVNETKTHVRQLPDETFDFLGYTFGLHRSNRSGRWMLRQTGQEAHRAGVRENQHDDGPKHRATQPGREGRRT